MIVIFVEFIDQLIDYPIYRASLTFFLLFCVFHKEYWRSLLSQYK